MWMNPGCVAWRSNATPAAVASAQRRCKHEPDIASRASGPVWQAQFDDPQRTALYFAADDGHFIVARTATWRLYDFFWMLHTMDYVGRDNFNNPLIVTIGMATLWLSISGVLLLIRSFR